MVSKVYCGERMKIMDEDLLEMKLREISDLLSCQYDKNVQIGVSFALLSLEGTSPSTGKRMLLTVKLEEKEE